MNNNYLDMSTFTGGENLSVTPSMDDSYSPTQEGSVSQSPFAERLDNFIANKSRQMTSSLPVMKRGGENKVVNPGAFVTKMYDMGGPTNPAISQEKSSNPTIDDYVNKVLGQLKNNTPLSTGQPGNNYMAMGGEDMDESTGPFMDKSSRFANKIKDIAYNKLIKTARYDLKRQMPEIMQEVKSFQYGGEPCTDAEKMDPESECYDEEFTKNYLKPQFTQYDPFEELPDQGEDVPKYTAPYKNPMLNPPTDSPIGEMPGVWETGPIPRGLSSTGKDIYGNYLEPNKKKINYNISTLSGPNQANMFIAGMQGLTGIFEGIDNLKNKGRMIAQTHADKVFMKSRKKDKGKYTVNEGYFDPLAMIPVQFRGVDYSNPYSAMGGEQNPYEEGMEYDLSDEEIQKILDSGGDVEFLD